jgi:hypothetical protein
VDPTIVEPVIVPVLRMEISVITPVVGKLTVVPKTVVEVASVAV